MAIVTETPELKIREFEVPSEGAHLAIVGLLADIGKQEVKFGDHVSIKEQLFVRFILLNELMKDGQTNLAVSEVMTNSLHEKAKFASLASATDSLMQGKLDVNKLLLTPVIIEIEHYARKDGGKGCKVTKIGKLVKGMGVPEHNIKGELFNLSSPDHTIFSKLPKWVQDKVNNRKGVDVKIEAKVNKLSELNPEDLNNVPF